jgi:hypothetical protein
MGKQFSKRINIKSNSGIVLENRKQRGREKTTIKKKKKALVNSSGTLIQ